MDAIWERFLNYFNSFAGNPGIIVTFAIGVIAFTVLYAFILRFFISNKDYGIVAIFIITLIVSAVIVSFNKNIETTFFLLVPATLFLAVVILFNVELKRYIWSKRQQKVLDENHKTNFLDAEKINRCIDEIIKALQDMSKNDIGAIIVLSNNNIPSQILDSGVAINSDISDELIESVFFPKTPLHDGAMIIDGTKIVAAGCFLPLSQNISSIPKDLGTRHRAGLGVTETLDVVSLIVSEETGIISVAKAGQLTRYADTETLKSILNKYFWQEINSGRR